MTFNLIYSVILFLSKFRKEVIFKYSFSLLFDMLIRFILVNVITVTFRGEGRSVNIV